MVKLVCYCFLYLLTTLPSCHGFSSFLSSFGRYGRGECFVKVRNNLRLRRLHVNDELMRSSLRECEEECRTRSCESFSFSDTIRNTFSNCLLSKSSSRALNLLSLVDFVEDDDFDHYEKDYQLCRQNSLSIYGGINDCFRLFRARSRLPNSYVGKSLRTTDRTECERRCLMENTFLCKGINFRPSRLNLLASIDNCQLTNAGDIVDRTIFYDDQSYDFYERTSFSGDCTGSSRSLNYNDYNPFSRYVYDRYNDFDSGYRYPDSGSSFSTAAAGCGYLLQKGYSFSFGAVRDRYSVSNFLECQLRCQNSVNYVCRSFAFRILNKFNNFGLSYNDENCYLSDVDVSTESRYNLVKNDNFDVYVLKNDRGYGVGCGSGINDDSGFLNYNYNINDDYSGIYGREDGRRSVSGIQCKSRCRKDTLMNFYFCETEFGWDYCCRPGDYCRNADTYGVPWKKWCSVGTPSSTFWRPCEDSMSIRRAFLREAPVRVVNVAEEGDDWVESEKNKSKADLKMKKDIEVLDLNDIL